MKTIATLILAAFILGCTPAMGRKPDRCTVENFCTKVGKIERPADTVPVPGAP